MEVIILKAIWKESKKIEDLIGRKKIRKDLQLLQGLVLLESNKSSAPSLTYHSGQVQFLWELIYRCCHPKLGF